MKMKQRESEKPIGYQMRNSSTVPIGGTGSQSSLPVPKILIWLILFVTVTYVFYTFKLLSTSRVCNSEPFSTPRLLSSVTVRSVPNATVTPIINLSKVPDHAATVRRHETQETPDETKLRHVVFGIAASAKLWEKRKNYIKLWYKPKEMRGVVWLDNPVKANESEGLPQVRISADTSKFAYTNTQGHRSAIRISRIISETLQLGIEDVRWFVMGDDDTVFIPDNLLRILRKYDHNQFYYIGSLSESHLQNIFFSYSMAYGGGGFVISYPLAKALFQIQDRCIQRYPGLYGSDDRMQACMAELGVPLSKELGFHQYDVYGNLFGLLAAHPVTPLVSLHHLDVVEPIFPNMTRVEALQRLMIPAKLDSAALMQQSICYDKSRGWTISVSWGFAVQIFRGIFSPREMEMPARTFLNWYRRADYTAYAFNTRPVSRNPCQKPFVFYLSKAILNSTVNQTVSEYMRHRVPHPICRWRMANPASFDKVEVYKRTDPYMWNRSPRRNCCRVIDSEKNATMIVDVGACQEGEFSQVQ